MRCTDEPRDSYTLNALDWLTHAECARRLAIHPDEIRQLIRLPDSDPRHLPGVLVRACGVAPSERGWRVHPEVFEQYLSANCSPTPPPVEAMNTEELIEFLAGQRISSRTGAYRWWRERIREAVAFGVLTDYLVIGRARWSPAEAAAVKDALGGIKSGGGGGEARRAFAEMREFADIAEAMRIRGVTRGTAEGWAGQGDKPVRFGAVKIGREAFFERAQLESQGRVTTQGKAIIRKREKAKRTPSQIARLQDGRESWASARESAAGKLGLITASQVGARLPREVRREKVWRHVQMGGLVPTPNDLGLLLFSDDAVERYVEWLKQHPDGRLRRFNAAKWRANWIKARHGLSAARRAWGRANVALSSAKGATVGRPTGSFELPPGVTPAMILKMRARGMTQEQIAIAVSRSGALVSRFQVGRVCAAQHLSDNP